MQSLTDCRSNPESLFHEVRTAWETLGLLERLGQGARQAFEARYTEDANAQTLMAIDQQAITANQERRGGR